MVTNQRVLTWHCACTPDKSTSKWQRFAYKAYALISIVSVMSVTLLTLLFVVKNISTNLEEALFAIFQITGSGATIYVNLFAIRSQHKIAAIFKSLSEIYNASKKKIPSIFKHIFIMILSSPQHKRFNHIFHSFVL